MAALYEIKQVITDLAAAYPDWKPPHIDQTIKQYEKALEHYPIDLVRRASDRCRDVCIFFPKIAEMRKAISEIQAANAPFSQYSDELWKDLKWEPRSAEMQKKMDAFRKHMIDTGKWKDNRRGHLLQEDST
jgi:hypothetical protein